MKYFQDLKNKSVPERKKFLWLVAGITSALMLLVWLIVIPKDYLARENAGESQFSSLKGQIQESLSGEEYNQMQGGVDKIKTIDGEIPQLEEIVETDQKLREQTSEKKEGDTVPINRLPLED
ncbi:hypothetical protein KJ903_01340 [Patescibacteria group bacterium]|nr:hypothetical protein [Patescibacteria group bacterium]